MIKRGELWLRVLLYGLMVERSDLSELHYITRVDNVPSILQHGLLCHQDAQQFEPISVADPQIQARRQPRRVPNGLPLHQYVNLYINARNPMMYKVCHDVSAITVCVLQISTDVLDLPQVVIADGNASSDYTRFEPSPDGLRLIDSELVFAESWTDNDQIKQWRKKRAICAEVLVPGKIEFRHVTGIYVAAEATTRKFEMDRIGLPVIVNRRLFFQGG